MEILCPECDRPFAASEMNVAKDVAVCPECDEAYALSELVADQKVAVEEFDLGQPPPGVSFERTEIGWRLTSTTRSPVGFILVPFALLWCGVGLPNLYVYLVSGNYDWGQTAGASMFCFAALVLTLLALMTTVGRLSVSGERGEGAVFIGIGPIGWTRRFDWKSIRKVEEENIGYRYSGSHGLAIALIGQDRTKFGSMLTDRRRYFMVQALRKLLKLRTN
jgi:hypothetical protein